MRLLFSEGAADYRNYVFPYVVWGFLEEGEHPADALAAGFLPSLPDLSRFYLCRQVRIALSRFSPTSENRRVLRHGAGISCRILPREQFAWTSFRRDFCLACARARWSSPPSSERIERIFASPVTTHVALFADPQGRDVGIVSLLRDGATWFYSNAFYDPQAPSGRGAFLMTETVRVLSEGGQGHLHLGTCYSRSALYKTQFPGVEFFDGTGWSGDLRRLKELLSRAEAGACGHLLEDEDYLDRWIPEGLSALAQGSSAALRRTLAHATAER